MSPKKVAFGILGLSLLESALLGVIPSYFILPRLSVLVFIAASVKEGPRIGFRCGLFLGFLTDTLGSEPFGFYTALYSIGGVLLGLLKQRIFTDSILAQCLVPGIFLSVLLGMEFVLEGWHLEPERTFLFMNFLRNSAWVPAVLLSPFVFWLSERFFSRKKKPTELPIH